MCRVLRFAAGLGVGCAIAAVIGTSGFFALRLWWPGYAAAEPDKSYTLAMLVARLTLGALATAGAAWSATMVAGDRGTTAWVLGGLFLSVSAPLHLFHIWADYPAWYHFVYLADLVPIAGMAGRWSSQQAREGTLARQE